VHLVEHMDGSMSDACRFSFSCFYIVFLIFIVNWCDCDGVSWQPVELSCPRCFFTSFKLLLQLTFWTLFYISSSVVWPILCSRIICH